MVWYGERASLDSEKVCLKSVAWAADSNAILLKRASS
jgi:hypothetical protein